MKGQETPGYGSRLVGILADMLGSALAWEQEQSSLSAEPERGPDQGLNRIHIRIHYSTPDEKKSKRQSSDAGAKGHDDW
jgi:hypothetical protein